MPAKVTVLSPWSSPKLAPLTYTEAPIAAWVTQFVAEGGVPLERQIPPSRKGGACVMKMKGWLAVPLAFTTTGVFADGETELGTVTLIAVPLQLVIGAVVPLMLTVPEEPKPEPLMVIAPPTGIQLGATPMITGGGTMVMFTPLL